MSALQKRLLTCLLVLCMAMSFTACGRLKEAANVLMGKEEVEEELEEEEEDKKSKKDKKEKEDEEDKKAKEDEEDKKAEEDEEKKKEDEKADEDKKKSASGQPTLGQMDIENYDGFEYLYCEKLRTDSTKNEETGEMESFELPVFIPLDDYVYSNRDYVSGSKLGVEFKVSLQPSLRYDAEDYLDTENLDYYLESQYDPYYRDNCKDVVISDAKEMGKDTAYATVEYCYYDKYEDTYSPVLCTYYYTKLESGVDVLVEFEVSADEVTGKTPAMIEELEAFYPFDINWDADRAAAKLETYLASGGDNTFTTGYLLFELPDGWDQDNDAGDYDYLVYAPGGDASKAGCYISFQQEYAGYKEVEDSGLLDSEKTFVDSIQAMAEELEIDGTASFYGDTCLGDAVVLETKSTTDNGEQAAERTYFLFDDSYMYMITSVQAESAVEDADAVLQDILENGQIKE